MSSSSILTQRLQAGNLRERALQAASNGSELEAKRWQKAVAAFIADIDAVLAVRVDPENVTRGRNGMPEAIVDTLVIRRYGLTGLQVAVECQGCRTAIDRTFSTLGDLGAYLEDPGLCPKCEQSEIDKRRQAQGWGLRR